MPLEVGLMDREIVLKTAERSQNDETGEETIAWDLHDETIFAQWIPRTTSELNRQDGTVSYLDGVFRMHWRDDVSADASRIVWDGKIFDVRPPVEIDRRAGLDVPVVARGE